MFKDLPESTKSIISSTLPTVVIFILAYFVGNFGISKISDIRLQIRKSQQNMTTYKQKLETLRNISDLGTEGVTAATVALPDSNPVVAVSSQLKILGVQHNLLISNIKSGGEVADSNGLSRVDVSFDASGNRAEILKMAEGISGLAPITILDKVKLAESASGTIATFAVRSYWSPFPKELPAITEKISDLTDNEKEILSNLANLTQPQFTSIPAPSVGGRVDPFNP